jgi:hypothetical protein
MHTLLRSRRITGSGSSELPSSPATAPDDFVAPQRTTGTADDDDDPGDEHARENEASVHAINERIEAPEEFEIDAQDGAPRLEGDDEDDGDDPASD